MNRIDHASTTDHTHVVAGMSASSRLSILALGITSAVLASSAVAGPGYKPQPTYNRPNNMRPVTPPNRSSNYVPPRPPTTFTPRTPRTPRSDNLKAFNRTTRSTQNAPNLNSSFTSSGGRPPSFPKDWGGSKTVVAIRNKFALAATNNQAIKLRKKLSLIKISRLNEPKPALTLHPRGPGHPPELGSWEGQNTSGYTPPANAKTIIEKTIEIGSRSRFLSAEFKKAQERTEPYPSHLTEERRGNITDKLSSLDEFNKASVGGPPE